MSRYVIISQDTARQSAPLPIFCDTRTEAEAIFENERRALSPTALVSMYELDLMERAYGQSPTEKP